MASTIAEIATAHAAAHGTLDKVQKLLVGWLGVVCDEISISRDDTGWVRIEGESRIKNPTSLQRALDEAGLEAHGMWEIDDLVGARAVVLRLSDAKLVVEGIMSSEAFRLEDLSPDHIHDDQTGYRAKHVKGWMHVEDRRVGCEIQIRTELQDAWAVVSRTDLYRKGETAEVVIEAAKIQADHLAAHDRFFELIPTLAKMPPPIRPRAEPKSEFRDECRKERISS